MLRRVFLVVMDSVGIGGAPDADLFFNDGIQDTGSNTVLHIAEQCAYGKANIDRFGPLKIPNLSSLGLGEAISLSCGRKAPGLECSPQGKWGVATETSKGKDTPSGHWELAGLPIDWDWHFFSKKTHSFPKDLIEIVCNISGTSGILGNCHNSGTEIISELGEKHCTTGWPICYTSADSVFQIAAHEKHFGLNRLMDVCERLAPEIHRRKVGRLIARPFLGDDKYSFRRTENRRDFALAPPKKVLTNWVQDAGHPVIAIGKIGDVFSMHGIDQVYKGTDIQLMAFLKNQVISAKSGSFIFANFVEFDSLFGHRRDVAGYAKALEWFDKQIGHLRLMLRENDIMILTADHGNDPTWVGTGHTRERVPVLCIGNEIGCIGHIGFKDVAKMVLDYLKICPQKSEVI